MTTEAPVSYARHGSGDERRRRPRMQVHWQLRFGSPGAGDAVETATKDLSSEGFYCVAKAAFVPGELLDCTLGVPTHHPEHGDQVLLVQCMVRVVRVEAVGENGLQGVGCRIEDYQFAHSTAAFAPIAAEFSPRSR